jgi:hypothetical protein
MVILRDDRCSRNLQEVILLTSYPGHVDWCRCPHPHGAAASPRAPVSLQDRANPISLSCRDLHACPSALSRMVRVKLRGLSGQTLVTQQEVVANSTRVYWYRPRSRTLSWSYQTFLRELTLSIRDGSHNYTLLSAKFERLDDLESRVQADLDNICETFNVERRSIKFEKWRTTP